VCVRFSLSVPVPLCKCAILSHCDRVPLFLPLDPSLPLAKRPQSSSLANVSERFDWRRGSLSLQCPTHVAPTSGSRFFCLKNRLVWYQNDWDWKFAARMYDPCTASFSRTPQEDLKLKRPRGHLQSDVKTSVECASARNVRSAVLELLNESCGGRRGRWSGAATFSLVWAN